MLFSCIPYGSRSVVHWSRWRCCTKWLFPCKMRKKYKRSTKMELKSVTWKKCGGHDLGHSSMRNFSWDWPPFQLKPACLCSFWDERQNTLLCFCHFWWFQSLSGSHGQAAARWGWISRDSGDPHCVWGSLRPRDLRLDQTWHSPCWGSQWPPHLHWF